VLLQHLSHGVRDPLRVDVEGRGATVLLAHTSVAVSGSPALAGVAGLTVRRITGVLRQ
jgi:hypothetical protein